MEERSFSRCSSTVDLLPEPPQAPDTAVTSRVSDVDAVTRRKSGCRKRRHQRPTPTPLLICFNLPTLLIAFLVSLAWFSPCMAAAISFEGSNVAYYGGEILFDRSPPPQPRMRLIRRAEPLTTASTSTSASVSSTRTSASESESSTVSTSATASTSSKKASSTTASSATASSTVSLSDLPSPFDTSLGNNFTSSSCPKFFETFLSDSTFQECLPFSLLLQVRAHAHAHVLHAPFTEEVHQWKRRD